MREIYEFFFFTDSYQCSTDVPYAQCAAECWPQITLLNLQKKMFSPYVEFVMGLLDDDSDSFGSCVAVRKN